MLVAAFGEKLREILFPDSGQTMRAVAAGLVCDGYQDEATISYFLDLRFGDAKFRRMDLIIGGVNKHDRHFDRRRCAWPAIVVDRRRSASRITAEYRQ